MRFAPAILVLGLGLIGSVSQAQMLPPRLVWPVADAAPVEKRPWVGVSVSPAPASLRHQLKVPDGVGLVVEFVQPQSPAADAGLRPFDLLTKLDDQWLINPEQFAVLVRMHHAGDTVKLTYLREGDQHAATVKLVEHEVPVAPEWDGGGDNFAWPDAAPPPRPRPPRSSADRGPNGQTTIRWMGDHRELTLTMTNGHRTLKVQDAGSGAVLFEGPVDTADQRDRLPADVRRELDEMTRVAAAFEARRRGGADAEPAPAAPQTQPADGRNGDH